MGSGRRRKSHDSVSSVHSCSRSDKSSESIEGNSAGNLGQHGHGERQHVDKIAKQSSRQNFGQDEDKASDEGGDSDLDDGLDSIVLFRSAQRQRLTHFIITSPLAAGGAALGMAAARAAALAEVCGMDM
jgi:hypothetical protein